MPAYELMFIVKPELDEEQVTTATDRVHQLIVANGGTVARTSAWGKRRLAYAVGANHEGYYVVSNFTIDAAKIGELERVLKISDTVFRHLLVRRDKPLPADTEVDVPEMSPEDVAYFAEQERLAVEAPADAEGEGTEEPVAEPETDAEPAEEEAVGAAGVAGEEVSP